MLANALLVGCVSAALVVGIVMPKNCNSTVTKFCHLALGGPVIMPHRLRMCVCVYISEVSE